MIDPKKITVVISTYNHLRPLELCLAAFRSQTVIPGEILIADDGSGAEYYALYLTERCSPDAMVAVSDLWGHYHSRVIDDAELISYWARTHDEA